MTALGAVWPALRRGGMLLATGRVRQFTQKLFNEAGAEQALAAAPVRSGPPLVLAGHILRPGGYDHLVLAVLKGLVEAGVNVIRDPGSVLNLEQVPESVRPGEGSFPDSPRLIITPPHLLHRFHPDRRSTAFTMWETDTLPRRAVHELNRCGRVIVPSKWGEDCFRANGVTAPIDVVPLGHDSQAFHFMPPQTVCVFGTAGALDDGGMRKNVPQVIAWFRAAFPHDPDVRLRVKITPASPPVSTFGDPRIDVVEHSLGTIELAEWYASLTAFVNGSFGEGFGLHLLEAMACGRPLISTAFGGSSAFFDESVGHVVPHRIVEAKNAVYAGNWAEPDGQAMIAEMQQVRTNPEQTRQLGERAAIRAAGFTWAAMVERLRAICTLPT